MKISNLLSSQNLILAQDYMLGLIFLLVPLFYTGLAFQGLIFEKFSLFFFIICSALIMRVCAGFSIRWRNRTKFDLPILAIAISILTSFIFSSSFTSSLIGSFATPEKSVVAFACYLALYYLLANSRRAVQISIWFFVVAMSVIFALNSLSYLGLVGTNIMTNMLGSNSTAAKISIMLMPLFLFLAWKTPTLKFVKISILRTFLIVSCLGLLMLIVSNFTTPNSIATTHEHWQIFSGGIKNSSLLGTGPGTQQLAIARYRIFDEASIATAPSDQPLMVSSVLELFLTLGLAGVIAFSFFAYSFWQAGKQAVLLSEGLSQAVNIGLIIGSTIAVLFIASDSSGILFIVSVLLLVITMSSISTTLDSTLSEATSSTTIWGKVGSILVIIGLTCIIIFGATQLAADCLAKKIVETESLDKKIELAERSASLAPQRPEYSIIYGNLTLLRGYKSMAIKDSNALNDFRRSFVTANKAIVASPENGEILEEVGNIFEAVSVADATAISYAEQVYRKLIQLEPHNPVPYLKLAKVLEKAGELSTQDQLKTELFGNALSFSDKSVSLYQNYVEARLTGARIKDKLGFYDEAIAETKAIAMINPLPSIRYELARRLFNRGVSRKGQIHSVNMGTINDMAKLEINYDTNNARINMNEDLKESLKILTNLKEEHPNYSNALYTLALLEYRLGRVDEARKDFIGLLKIIPVAEQESIRSQFLGI